MNVTETLSDGLKRGYTIVVPAADLESRRQARLADLGKTLRLPGFRPGKVPLPVVRQRYGGAVNAEILEESVNEATRQVLSDRGLRPAMQPRVDVVSQETEAGKDLEFKLKSSSCRTSHHLTFPRSSSPGPRQRSSRRRWTGR